MAWRVAKSLLRLRDQINAAAPKRDKSADGTVGDSAHSSRASDHNPTPAGVVCAMDITHDPNGGVDSYKLAEFLKGSGDKRIKYIISNGRIWNPSVSPGWRKYSGSNPHNHHVHVSVKAALADDVSNWVIGMGSAGIVARTVAVIANVIAPQLPKYPLLKYGKRGDDVKRLQALLKIEADGVFGKQTEAAVKAAQKKHKLVVDGKVGIYSWKAFGG